MCPWRGECIGHRERYIACGEYAVWDRNGYPLDCSHPGSGGYFADGTPVLQHHEDALKVRAAI